MNFMLELVGLLIAYYFIFWAFVHHKPLRRLKKPYRLACFILGCYWALFFLWLFMQAINVDFLVQYKYERLSSLLNDLIGSCLTSLFFSGLFLGAVYIYQNYVNCKEEEQ